MIHPRAYFCACQPVARFDVLAAGVGSARVKRRLVGSAGLTIFEAEFRGPGVHHRFDASDEDEYMDMDQRTRLIGGRGGRIILLGDGTEIHTGTGEDDDVDMEDRGEAEEADDSDIEEQIKKGQAESSNSGANGETDASRAQREETPGPNRGADKKSEEKEQPKKDGGSSSTPEEPKMKAPTDGPATE